MLSLMAMFFGLEHVMAQSDAGEPVKGVVRVKFQREVADRIASVAPFANGGVVKTGVEPLDNTGGKLKVVQMKRVFPYSPKFEEKHRKYGLDLWYDVYYDETSVSPASAMNMYKSTAGVQKVETVVPVVPIGGEKGFKVISSEKLKAMTADASAKSEMPFNDPLLSKQWHYKNEGTLPGSVAGADINLFEAWKIATGTSDVIVAVIDGGIEYGHPDLTQNVFVNEAELNGQPGVDDDGNGYVDDVYGYNFVINSADVSAHDHGTHVAGTVGAVNGNGVGVAGVAGGNGQGGVKMLSCQIFDSRSSANANYAAALVYAADMGASIAQCSWGWSTSGYVEQAVIDAIDYFTAEGGGDKMSGGLCIFANGNTSDEGEYWPACYDKVVAVGAITCMKTPASYSSRGDWCDVSAPGGDMDYGEEQGVLSTLPNGSYGYSEGTSMACPHVSGIAALILSKYGNSNFSNETLRTQLVTSVNDLYTDNPEVTGKFGSGYIDAYKAMHVGTGTAPQAVDDFTLSPSQDNILIEWIIPDSEEKSVDHHVVYYSTTPFDASSLDGVKHVNVDTKFQTSGNKFQYELSGLNPLTTYYIAIVAYNRWGDGSELSPVKSATTNAGPEASLSVENLDLNIDASSSDVASAGFDIINNGEGILKYNISTQTISAYASTFSNGAASVVPGKIVPFNGAISAMPASAYPVVSAEYTADDYPQTLTYSQGIFYYVGESDLTKPNALAQYFYVDPDSFPNGFNLTALNFGGTSGGDVRPEIEIYSGAASISKATLLQKVEYDFFMYMFDIYLREQLFFEPGSAFWVVAKFPAGLSNPLGGGQSVNGENTKQYSFYSSDNGQTWTQLSEVLREGDLASAADIMTWDVRAISYNPDWSSVLTIEPSEGVVRSGEKNSVVVKNDGQKLVNGQYSLRLNVGINEAERKNIPVSVSMNVSGNKPVLSTAKIVDFGNLLVGESKTLEVEVVNSGYGVFTGDFGLNESNISCTSDQFVVPTYREGFSARSKGYMTITFAPTKAGNQSGTVKLTDKDGITHTFIVRGVSSMPAEISVDKDSFKLGELEVGGEGKKVEFTITNTGEYPLQYVFPKFSTDNIDGGVDAHRFGYTSQSNINGDDSFAYDGNPQLIDSVDITGMFDNSTWISDSIKIGFSFPFYGQNYDKVYVTSYGSIVLNTIEGNIQCIVPVSSCVQGLGYISGFATSGKFKFGKDSKIVYGRQDGKFIVKFINVLCPPSMYSMETNVPVSFHMALCSDGSVEVYYDDYNAEAVLSEGANLYVGVSDVECTDPFVITDADYVFATGSEYYKNIASGSAIKILAPAQSMIAGVSSASGMIDIGGSQKISVDVKAEEGLYAGELVNNLTILTNDPKTPSKNIVISAEIVGSNLAPQVTFDSLTLDFGKVFRTSDAVRGMLLRNTGSADLTVKSVVSENGAFIIDKSVASGFVVPAGGGKDIKITLPTETEGKVADKVIVTYGDDTKTEIAVSGEVIGVPGLSLKPAKIAVTTPFGENVDTVVTVSNTGNETLSFTTVPNSWIILKDQVEKDNSEVSYSYKSSSENEDVDYNWIDLEDGSADRHETMSYFLDKTDTMAVELPFPFPFYGKTYDRMYIYNTGFVSFSQHDDYKEFPVPPVSLPNTNTFYTNIIAPFWGNHSMDTTSDSGIYYKEEGDHVVVSFINYGNSMMVGMNFQLIIYSDGRFKYQYHLDSDGMMIGVFGLAGLQDENAERGIQLPNQYIADGNAVEFYPSVSYNVAPGTEVGIPVEIKADSLADTYLFSIDMNTNVPKSENVGVPVEFTISGEALPQMPEKFETEVVSDVNNYSGVVTEFTISNKGAKAFNITNIASKLFDAQPPFYMSAAVIEVYTTFWDFLTGSYIEGWTAYTPGMDIKVGFDPVPFRITYYDAQTVALINENIEFTLEGVEGLDKVTVPYTLNITEAPALTFDKPEIRIEGVADNYVGKETLNISNIGKYKLTYSLRLDPSGYGEVIPDDGGGIAPASNRLAGNLSEVQRKLAANCFSTPEVEPFAKYEGIIYDVPEEDYNDLLYYPILDVEQPFVFSIGSGATSDNFYAATRYVAPERGFNLSSLYFVSSVGDLKNVDIDVRVLRGSDVTSSDYIGRGVLHIDSETPDENGNYTAVPRMVDFENPVYINPGDTFYVVVKYPVGVTHPAYMSQKKDQVSAGRFMGWLSNMGWVDFASEFESQYGSIGYFMTCVEKEEGKPWIALTADSDMEGELEIGESVPVNFEINAASAYYKTGNKAVLVVKSNDPANKIVNYPIYLDKNAAPVVAGPEENPTVKENSTALVTLSVEDAEGDAFKASLVDADGIASIESCRTFNGSDYAEAVATDNTVDVPAGSSLELVVKLAPDFGDAGKHSFTINTEDALGNAATASVAYNVENTNRTPEFVGAETIDVAVGKTTDVIAFSSLFIDPDGDKMTFTASMPDNDFASIFASADEFVVSGRKIGTADLTLTAEDALGAKTTAQVKVNVVSATAIDDVDADRAVNVYPKAVETSVNVTLGADASNVTYTVFNANGMLVTTASAKSVRAGEVRTIDMSACSAGVYYVKVTADGIDSTEAVIKR